MILNDFTVPKTKYSNEQLDAVLVELCEIILEGKQDNPDFYGSVSAAVIDPKGRLVTGLNYLYGNYRIHAERAAIDKYEEEYGELPKGSIVVTTLSPCSDRMDSRYEESCADLLNSKGIKLAYCGYNDPTQENTQDKFVTIITENSKLKMLCKKFADTFLKKDIDENFADGRGPGRPGDSQRHGISKGASMAELEKASHSKGRKGQLARWQLNMRRGHKK
jgi:pyrimidine deaminase RibD-like protein